VANNPSAWGQLVTRRIALLAGLLALVVGGLAYVAIQPNSARSAEVRKQAETRWEQRPFRNYRMQLTEENHTPLFTLICTMDVEIRNEEIARVWQSDCPPPILWTVSGLFELTNSLEAHICYPAFSGGCACATNYQVQTNYHPQLGYPRKITRSTVTAIQYTHLDYWRYLVLERKQPWCSGIANSSIRTVTVESLTPLP
jgi:hypothetical protein